MNLTAKINIEDLIANCIKGDRKSQQLFFQSFYGKMLSVSFRYANDMDEAKDILQDAFIKVFAKLENFGNQGSLEGWIRRIVVNTAIDYIRRKKDFMVDIDSNPNMVELSTTDENSGLSDYAKMKAEILMKLIQKLSPAYRTVFNLFVIEEYTHKAIAEELGISEGTSKSNLAKAKCNLKQLFDDYIKKNQHELF